MYEKICPTKISRKFSRVNPGFTLIELLVTISIIGVLFGIGVAKYNEFNRRQILDQAAQELRSNLRLAQDKALAGEKDCSSSKCGGSDGICGTNDANEKSLEGWYVSFSANNYQIYGKCGVAQFSPQTVDLSGRNITLSSFPSNLVRFKPLAQGVDGATTISLSGYGETRPITVTGTGEIK